MKTLLLAVAASVVACAAHAGPVNFSSSLSTGYTDIRTAYVAQNPDGSLSWELGLSYDEGNVNAYDNGQGAETFTLTGGTGDAQIFMPVTVETSASYTVAGPDGSYKGVEPAFDYAAAVPGSYANGVATFDMVYGQPLLIVFGSAFTLSAYSVEQADLSLCGPALSFSDQCTVTSTNVGSGTVDWGTIFIPEAAKLSSASNADYSVSNVPEPSTLLLMLAGVSVVAVLTKRSMHRS